MVVSEKKNSVGFASRGSEMTVKGHGYHDKEPRRAKPTKNNVERIIIDFNITHFSILRFSY